MKILTKFPTVVEAADKQGISMDKVFAKLTPQVDGSVKASYPLVKVVDGAIPMCDNDGDGVADDIDYDEGRVAFAKTLGAEHDDPAVLDSIDSMIG